MRKPQPVHIRAGLGVAAAILAALAAILVANVGAAAQSDSDPGDTPKSEAPMNVNPDKTPIMEMPPPEPESPAPLSKQRELAEHAREHAKSDPGYVPCFTKDGLLTGDISFDLVDPTAPGLSKADKQRACDRAFPGSIA